MLLKKLQDIERFLKTFRAMIRFWCFSEQLKLSVPFQENSELFGKLQNNYSNLGGFHGTIEEISDSIKENLRDWNF